MAEEEERLIPNRNAWRWAVFGGKSEHDDLVIAVTLAVWWARLPESVRALAA